MEGRSFLRAFERRETFLYLGKFYEEFGRYVKRPCKRAALSIGALLGSLEEVRFLGILREKENVYLGSFFLDSEDTISYVLGPSGTSARNRASLS
jgi:hypothetical protein